MQINLPVPVNDRAGYAPMWYAPNVQNTALDTDVPPIYAPYPTVGYWPPSIQQAASMSGLGADPAAPTPNAAGAGQALSPISLVSPLPSIVQPPQTVSADQVPTPPMSISCQIGQWVNNNPMWATLAAVGVYYFLSQKGAKR